MKYHFKTHKQSGGFWAECVELPGCVTQADTRVALIRNMTEALNLFLDEPVDSKVVLSLPRRRLSGRNIIALAVDPQIAFAFALRRERLLRKLTQKAAARLLGIKTLYNYQRLETAKSANPSLSTLKVLKSAFPTLPLDEILA